MYSWKRLTLLALSVGLSITLLAACAGQDGEGFSLSASVGSEVTTLDPIYAKDVENQTVLVHLYENLMRVASDGAGGSVVVNGMAKKVDVDQNKDGTVTYSFRLRGAKWSDGRDVTAHDFVYAWQRLANPASHSPYADLLSVVCGYQEARSSGDMSLLQVTAKNDSTLVVTLEGNYEWFLSEVCTSPATMPLREDVVQALKEAEDERPWWADATALVTNGAYRVTSQEDDVMELAANKMYYGEMAGPSAITLSFAETPEEAWELYQNREVEIVWPLTEEHLARLAKDETWTPIPKLSTYSVVYHSAGGVMENMLIRQAFAWAIDRNELVKVAGVTALAAEGLIPPGVPENGMGDFRSVGGPLLDNDPEHYPEFYWKARKTLEEAGYNTGADLGELEFLYVEGDQQRQVAETLCGQWKSVLGVNVTPRGVSEGELWVALRSGEYDLAGVELESLGKDAECFLLEWTSDSPNNVVKYENSAYDTLMSIIAIASDGTARMGCLHDAEALLLEDFVISPLYTKGTDWEERGNLSGVVRDARGWFSFANVVKGMA